MHWMRTVARTQPQPRRISEVRIRDDRTDAQKMKISLGSPANQHDLHGLEHDHQIKPERGVLNVVKVVLQLLFRVFNGVPY